MNDLTSASHESAISIETELAAMWCDLLDLPEVGSDANFFDLGATSMTAIKLLQRVEKRFGLGSLAPEALYSAPTLAAMAKAVSDNTP